MGEMVTKISVGQYAQLMKKLHPLFLDRFVKNVYEYVFRYQKEKK